MKTSNIKPSFTMEQTKALPPIAGDSVPESFRRLTEGHFSQVFSYETSSGEKRVLRLGRKLYSFEADKFAHDHYDSPKIPVPRVFQIGEVEPGLFFCISELIEGTPSDQLPPEEFTKAQESIENCYAAIFKTDVTGTNGWGRLDVLTGDGRKTSYQEELRQDREHIAGLRAKCAAHNINPALVDEFAQNLEDNLPGIQVVRRLTHSDLGSDNVIIKDSKVSGIIDWSGVGYGDWLHDYSRLEFWYPGRHTPAMEFAKRHDLETQDFEKRWLAYTADHALSTLDYTFRYQDLGTQQWLRDNLESRIHSSGVR